MEFDAKAGSKIDIYLFIYFKLDKDPASKLQSSQKALWPFSTCFKATPKGPDTCPALTKYISPKDRALEIFYQTQAETQKSRQTGAIIKTERVLRSPAKLQTLHCKQTPSFNLFFAISSLIQFTSSQHLYCLPFARLPNQVIQFSFLQSFLHSYSQ